MVLRKLSLETYANGDQIADLVGPVALPGKERRYLFLGPLPDPASITNHLPRPRFDGLETPVGPLETFSFDGLVRMRTCTYMGAAWGINWSQTVD